MVITCKSLLQFYNPLSILFSNLDRDHEWRPVGRLDVIRRWGFFLFVCFTEANIVNVWKKCKLIMYNMCNKGARGSEAFETISEFWLMASFVHSLTPVSNYFTPSVLASPSSVPSTQRPRLHIQPGWDRRPVWPFWCPHSQPLTPEIVVRVGSILPNMLIYLNFLPRCPPHWQWRRKEVQGSWCDLMSIQGHLCTDTVSSCELSQTVARCTASWRNAGENKTFYLLLFQGNIVKTNNYIFGLLCMIKR